MSNRLFDPQMALETQLRDAPQNGRATAETLNDVLTATLTGEARVHIRSSADIVVARQQGRELASLIGFSICNLTRIATAISEVARNIVEYAGEGDITITRIREGRRIGVKIVASDDGPGIADLAAVMRDGFSTGQGMGMGLPGARRLMDDFEISSEIARGTTVVMKKWAVTATAWPASPAASDPTRSLVDRYVAAFRTYASEPGEFALVRAYELGRAALIQGLGVLEMATVHSVALSLVLKHTPRGADRNRMLDASAKFLVEALSPFEMTHRGFREANTVLRRLNDMLEAQSKRIAYALHDEAAQLLVPLHLGLAEAARKVKPEVASDLAELRGLLDAIEERLRNLSHELRPPILDDFGLVPALEFLCTSVSRRWGIPVQLHAAVDGALAATVETTLYRITQEALTNVGKHARATHAHVSLMRAADAVVCSIRDNGVGFDAAPVSDEPRGLGLSEIRERVMGLGGMLHVGNNEGGGTKVTVKIPLEY